MNQYASVVASLDMNSQSIPRNATPQQAGATESASAPEPSSSQAAEPMVGAAADRANSRDPDSLKEATSVTSNDEAARYMFYFLSFFQKVCLSELIFSFLYYINIVK